MGKAPGEPMQGLPGTCAVPHTGSGVGAGRQRCQSARMEMDARQGVGDSGVDLPPGLKPELFQPKPLEMQHDVYGLAQEGLNGWQIEIAARG